MNYNFRVLQGIHNYGINISDGPCNYYCRCCQECVENRQECLHRITLKLCRAFEEYLYEDELYFYEYFENYYDFIYHTDIEC